MRKLGTLHRLDELGRIVIPMGVRRTMGLERGDQLEIFVDDELICFKKYYPEDNCIGYVADAIKVLDDKKYNDTEDYNAIKRRLEAVLQLLEEKAEEREKADAPSVVLEQNLTEEEHRIVAKGMLEHEKNR